MSGSSEQARAAMCGRSGQRQISAHERAHARAKSEKLRRADAMGATSSHNVQAHERSRRLEGKAHIKPDPEGVAHFEAARSAA